MSATLDAGLFASYFKGAATVTIPGFTHPVEDLYAPSSFLSSILYSVGTDYLCHSYLEDVVRATGYRGGAAKSARRYTDKENDEMRNALREQGLDDDEISTVGMISRSERIDYSLVGATAAYLISKSKEGAVLIFMPGVAEIHQATEAVRAAVPRDSKVEVLPLHANLTSAEQSRVFKRMSPGWRKVVVATNVAETSMYATPPGFFFFILFLSTSADHLFPI
jgi:ATP-dependent RNA helicase DHX57